MHALLRSAPLRAVLFALPLYLALSGLAVAESTRLTLLHIHDADQAVPAEGRTGFAELMTLIEAERAAADRALLLVSGDFLSPSVLSGLDQGANMIAMFNAIGVDYVGFGNHEFDFGPEVTAERIGESAFTWIGTNVLDEEGAPFAGAVTMAIEPAGDYTIGLLGLVTPDTVTLSSPGDQVDFPPVIETATRAAAELREQGADVVIALTHQYIAEDRALARDAEGIDVILGGHDHDPMTIYENGVLIHKSGSDTRYLGVIALDITTLDTRNGPAVTVVPQWAMRSTAGVAPDPEVAALIQAHAERLDAELAVTIGTTETALDSRRGAVRAMETTMGNLIADAMRTAVGADIAITNGGGIRGDRIYEPGTVLTRRDILAELPFGNVTVLIELTGAQVLAALENGVSQVENGAGRFPQVSGLAFTFDPALPPGGRIVDVTVGGAPLDPETVYRVATNDYMHGGGDGYEVLAGAPTIIAAIDGMLLASTVIDHITVQGTVAPAVDGRITRIE